jgi:hypothetical protein
MDERLTEQHQSDQVARSVRGTSPQLRNNAQI